MNTFPAPPELLSARERSPWSRFLWLMVAGWTSGCFAAYVVHGGTSWHYFQQGQQALADLDDHVSGGLHLYAALPFLQIGPVTFVATMLTVPFGPRALLVAQLFGMAAGVAILWLVRDLGARTRADLDPADLDRRTLLAAMFFIPVWTYLAVAVTHLDDVLALLFAVLGLRAVLAGRHLLAGVLLALAVDAKPWAVPFACLLLLLPAGRRQGAALAYAGVVAAAWLPFLVGDAGTLNALRFTIPNTPWSALRVLGVHAPSTPPWDRPAQVAVGVVISLLALVRRRWALAILGVIAARLALDPGTNHYYAAGVLVGAVLWDVVGSRRGLPWWSGAAFAGLFLLRAFPLPPYANGVATLAFFAAVCVLAALPSQGATPGEQQDREHRDPDHHGRVRSGGAVGQPAGVGPELGRKRVRADRPQQQGRGQLGAG
jgi:hypothetical protein